MGKKLYVGNLAYGVSDSTLEQLFSQYGTVQTRAGDPGPRDGPEQGFRICRDGHRGPGTSSDRGAPRSGARWTCLTVNEAKPREDRGGGGGYGGGGGGGGRGRGGGGGGYGGGYGGGGGGGRRY